MYILVAIVHQLFYYAIRNFLLAYVCLFFLYFIQSETGGTDEFFLVTRPEESGSPPARTPPPAPAVTELPISSPVPSAPILPDLSKSQSFHPQTVEERDLTIDDIEDFEDDEEEVSSARAASRRQQNDATDLSLLLPPFPTGHSLSTFSFVLIFFFML